MAVDRTHLKAAIAGMLDALAKEHAIKHQDSYGRRYVLETRTGKHLELMFEQSEKTPANIWIETAIAGGLLSGAIRQRLSPASGLYVKTGSTGALNYGRHSALENMPHLGKADLICLQPETLAEAGTILDHLLAV